MLLRLTEKINADEAELLVTVIIGATLQFFKVTYLGSGNKNLTLWASAKELTLCSTVSRISISELNKKYKLKLYHEILWEKNYLELYVALWLLKMIAARSSIGFSAPVLIIVNFLFKLTVWFAIWLPNVTIGDIEMFLKWMESLLSVTIKLYWIVTKSSTVGS